MVKGFIMNNEEQQYLNLLKECIENGTERPSDVERTGTGTVGTIGSMMKFDLSGNKIPLLTTKKVYWKGVVEELLWFIDGETDSYVLEDAGVSIWQGNTTREFLDNKHLRHVPTGDIGTGYGFQWRNWGGDYDLWISEGRRSGYDQLAELVQGLRDEPNSRRHVLSSWNVSQLDEMALPPCHMMSTFSVLGGKLHSCLLCRSQDLFLGTPFNLASYGLLTHLIANDLGIEAGSFTWFGADVHLYNSHREQAEEQFNRDPYDFPTITLPVGKSIFEVISEDIVLSNYQSHPAIKAEMAV